MSVKLANMIAIFSNSSYSYTAIGMRVNNYASAANSKLFYLEVNNTPRFNVGVDGTVIINSSANTNSNVNILQIFNANNMLMNLTSNALTINANVNLSKTTHINAYTEGFLNINTANSNLFLDLSRASVFAVTSSNNYISKINFIKPNAAPLTDKVYSCSVIFINISDIAYAAWTGANVAWTNDTFPDPPSGRTCIYTFTNVVDANNYFTGAWYGIVSGTNYSI